jgi:hypothetical protein
MDGVAADEDDEDGFNSDGTKEGTGKQRYELLFGRKH